MNGPHSTPPHDQWHAHQFHPDDLGFDPFASPFGDAAGYHSNTTTTRSRDRAPFYPDVQQAAAQAYRGHPAMGFLGLGLRNAGSHQVFPRGGRSYRAGSQAGGGLSLIHVCGMVFAFVTTVVAAYMIAGQCLERWGL